MNLRMSSEYSGEEKANISEDMKINLRHLFKKTRKYCKKRVKQSMYGIPCTLNYFYY